MDNKKIEILLYFLGYLKDNDFNVEKLGKFSQNLVVSGYNEHDVAEALDLLLDEHDVLSISSTEIAEQKDTSIRILSEFERITISPDVYGYLIKLHNLSIINNVQMEKIINYTMFITSHKITESDINEILASILFEEHMK